jgi:hypothetical protein
MQDSLNLCESSLKAGLVAVDNHKQPDRFCGVLPDVSGFLLKTPKYEGESSIRLPAYDADANTTLPEQLLQDWTEEQLVLLILAEQNKPEPMSQTMPRGQ